jgi:uncharacterized protein (DUF1015 family)
MLRLKVVLLPTRLILDSIPIGGILEFKESTHEEQGLCVLRKGPDGVTKRLFLGAINNMADVQPLRGLRYAREKVGNLAQIITPPFDVISQEAQTRYYERHPYNVIRLELGQQEPTDDALNNVYTRAAVTLSEWRLQGILYQEAVPCYYLYQQRFTSGGQTFTRTSLLARVRLEPWDARVVLPHEHIRTKDKEDRLNLLRACSANLSPIMCMYEDTQGQIRHILSNYADKAEVQIVDEVGEEHRLQPITDPEVMLLIHSFFAARQLYIADGHHRYTTALQYRDEVHHQRKELHLMDGVNFVLMALIDIEDPGWLVLPTHRMLFDLSQEQLNMLSAQQLGQYFTVQVLDPQAASEKVLAELAQAGQIYPSLVVKTPQQTLLLSINERGKERMVQSGHSTAWNELDVAMVQTLILDEQLGLSAEDIAAGRSIRYSHDTQTTWQALQSKAAQAIILLNAIPLRQVCDVAQADDRMPQKSTYLYPKLVTGLVMNPLW